MKLRENLTCPLELVHDMIKGKHKTLIIFYLSLSSYSLSGLKKEIEGNK